MSRANLSRSLAVLCGVFGLTLATGASAITVQLITVLTGAQETPSVDTDATGEGDFLYDTVSNLLTYDISFSGLSSAQTNAHIHGPADFNVPAGVLVPLPMGSPISGSVTLTEEVEDYLLGGLTYVNIHSVNFPAGEIRGQIQVVPEPSAYLMMGAGLGVLAWLIRRKRS